ncbi:MAG TPA: response regulator, partial [Candidatus Cloacimonadota bacterium]|nr:response regulator [Candidatus Cloacimonadota bacterium]
MKKRILIVDDEKNIRITLARSLTDANTDVDPVISAEEALDRLVLYQYDLVLLDLKLPGMSGLELIEKLNDMEIKAKIVVISAHGTVDTAVKCLKAGALDFIEKP